VRGRAFQLSCGDLRTSDKKVCVSFAKDKGCRRAFVASRSPRVISVHASPATSEVPMSKTAYGTLAGVAALAALAIAQPASALTMKQCSEKYKTASDAGSVGTTSWNDFRKAECGEGATMALKKVKTEKAKP
jgi:hypothetical protein